MIKRAVVALLACVAIATAVAGCGGGSDTTSGADASSDSGSAPTKVVFIREADAICGASSAKLLKSVEKFNEENGLGPNKEPTNAQALEFYEAVVLPSFAEQSKKIGELRPPAGDAKKVEEIVASLEAGVESAKANPQQLVQGKNPFAEAGAKARAYGLNVCGAG